MFIRCQCLISALVALIGSALAEPVASLPELGWQWPESQQGRFVQEKAFPNLAKPFTTRGFFIRQHGEFVWQTQQPVAQRMVIRDRRLFVQQGDGEMVEQPLAASMVGLLEAMISADFSRLREYFRLDVLPENGCVKLTPMDQSVGQVVQQARLCGEQYLERIVLEHQGQVRTTIELDWTEVEAGEP